MTNALFVAATLLLVSQPPTTGAGGRDARRMAFREAVQRYQGFVTPHCAPDDVAAYVEARRPRDAAVVRPLRHTRLGSDYRRALSDFARAERGLRYECVLPPPHPRRDEALAQHFAAEDRQFATMERLRDQIIVPAGDRSGR